jgi:general secretion pathway protein L
MTAWQEALHEPMRQVRQAWRDSPMPAFFAWWSGELSGLLPARLRAAIAAGPNWYLLAAEPKGWSVRAANGGDVHFIDGELDGPAQLAAFRRATASVAPGDLRVALVLPPGQVLRRELSLPAAARSNLRQVAGYEIDRQTPFRPEQVHFGVRELRDVAAPAGKVMVELAATPRGAIDPPLDRLAAAGIAIDAVDTLKGDRRVGFNLLPPERRAQRVDRRRRLNMILAASALVLAVAAMAAWVHNRQSALDAMEAEVEGMRADAKKVSALRQRLMESAGAAGFLAQRKSATVSVLSVLDELTRRLPDDTWLERLTISNTGDLGFQGQSPQAAKLVDALKGARLIGEPSFQGTIATDPSSGKERFYMVAKVKPPAAAPTPAPPPATPAAASTGGKRAP